MTVRTAKRAESWQREPLQRFSNARLRSSPVSTVLRAHFMHVACTFSGWSLTYSRTTFFGTQYRMCVPASPHRSQYRSLRLNSFGIRLRLGMRSVRNTLIVFEL